MISLCTEYAEILSALNKQIGAEYICEYIRLFLESYGVDYNFQEFYLQFDEDFKKITSVILRYNNQIFVSVTQEADLLELCAFLSGFAQCTVIADKYLGAYFPECDTCYIMSKNGSDADKITDDIRNSDNHKEIATLVTASMTQDKKADYLLNLSHQLRHKKVCAYVCYVDHKPVSAVVMSTLAQNSQIITTVYTHEYFRGNGYAKRILDNVCCGNSNKYILLCEEHNLKFYEKSGFSLADTCVRFRL